MCRKSLRLQAVVLAMLLLSGCSGLLPRSGEKTTSIWDSYEAVKQAYDQVQVEQTGKAGLKDLGFTPERSPNVRILTHLEIVNRVMPHQALSREDLPPRLLACLGHRDGCQAYELKLHVIKSKRYGNFLADFLNFRRKTAIRGWEFNAVFVLQDDVVVYKVWTGTPQIDERRDSTNPLGPLQSIGGEAVRRDLY